MADPIEIIQTVISVSQQIHSVVKNIQGAPDEMKDIDRKISRTLPILEHLETLGQRAQEETRDRDARALQGLCDEARELVEIAKGFLGSSNDGTFKLRKKEWPRWLMKKTDREDLAKRFHDLYGAICAYLSYDVHRELTVGLRVIRGTHQVYGSAAANQRDVGQHLYSEHDERLGYQMAQRVMRSAAQSQTQEFNQHYDEVTTADIGTLVPATMLRPDPAICTDSLQPYTTHQGNPCNELCPPSCRCRCHHPPITPIPQFLRSVVGNISVDHDWVSALRSICTPCNDQRCRRHRSNLLKIKYYCPTWFAQINAEIRTERLPVHFVIQTPRVVETMTWLQYATLDEVRQKLWSRELTVNDIRPSGESVLHIMTWRLTVDRSDAALSILALLTQHSAPTDWEANGFTPTEHSLWSSLVYWRRYESRTAALNAFTHRLGPHLPQDIDDACEELAAKLRWTELHRLICPVSSPALTSIPPELAPQVNIEDSWGWTPLLYATLVRPEAVHGLLAAGVNPRIDNIILSWAARAGADNAISMLVRAGAFTNASDTHNYTVLHWTAHQDLVYSINGLAVALELVRHAGHLLHWDVRDEYGDTPLDWARGRVHRNPYDEDSKRIFELYQTRQLPDGAQYIPTQSSADMENDSREDDGTSLPLTSLIRAGLRGDVDAIGDLVRRGAMVNEHDHKGRTLLHLVALGRVPDGYCIALKLVRHGGWGVDWDALVSNGGQEDDESEDGSGDNIRENNNDKKVEDDGEARCTALEIAHARLNGGDLTEQEHEELTKIRNLLEAHRLPLGETYLWPCMDPDFYKPKLEPVPAMPGAWVDE